MFDEKRILITGGTGTVGKELVNHILRTWEPEEIRIFSRSEISQVEMREKLRSPRLKFVIGDIRDSEAIMEACKGIDYVFHLAALKHIGICEQQPIEALKTNIFGAVNLAKAANACHVKRVVNMSTDKVVNPNSFYGNSKGMAERLFRRLDAVYFPEFLNIRSGNVIGSSGSVVPLLIKQIKENNEVFITDARMTRYFCSVSDIVEYLSMVMLKGNAGHTYITENRVSFRLIALVNVLIEKYGNASTKIRLMDLRPGEKIHEEMFTMDEVVYSLGMTGEESRANLSPESSADVVIDDAILKHYV